MAEGFLDFGDGNILTAAQVDDYLMRQSVMRFASPAARDTALSGVLAEGMVAYLKDVDSFTFYNGSAWKVFAGSWTAFTPTVKFGSTAWTLSTNDSRYIQVGNIVHVTYAFRASSFNGGSGTINVTTPVTLRAGSLSASNVQPLGTGYLYDASATAIHPFFITADGVLRSLASPAAVFTHSSPVVVEPGGAGTGDEFFATLTYEAS